MKYILILLLSFSKSNLIFAQPLQVYITLNPNECISCLYSLSNVYSKIDVGKLKIFAVLEEQYKDDSSILIDKLKLENYKFNYLFSISFLMKSNLFFALFMNLFSIESNLFIIF